MRLVVDTNAVVSAILWQGTPGRLLEMAGEMLLRQFAVQSVHVLREQALPHAEAAGYITDGDVFRDVS